MSAGQHEGTDRYELPVHDSGRALITDPAALQQVLDDEDVERVLGRRLTSGAPSSDGSPTTS